MYGILFFDEKLDHTYNLYKIIMAYFIMQCDTVLILKLFLINKFLQLR